MADQATVSRNGKSAPMKAANSITGLLHDVIALAEMQVNLALCDLKALSRGLIVSAILIVIAALLMLGAIFTAYLVGAYALIEYAEWSQVAAFGTSAGGGVIVALLLGLIAYFNVRGSIHKFDRSREELSENLQALKAMLKDHERN